jgi:hypothetical protein
MRRIPWMVLGLTLGIAGGLAGARHLLSPAPKHLPDASSTITRLREAARLETLDVALYKKVAYAPDPPLPTGSTLDGVVDWARYRLRNAHGRAILFGTAHLGLDLSQLDPQHVRVDGDRVVLVLPPVTERIELDPGATEIIDSNLDSAETAQLLDDGKQAFARDVRADAQLRARARRSAERGLRALLLELGFREVQFVDVLPEAPRA